MATDRGYETYAVNSRRGCPRASWGRDRVHIEGNHGLRVGTALCVHLSEHMAISSRPIASWLAVADGGVS